MRIKHIIMNEINQACFDRHRCNVSFKNKKQTSPMFCRYFNRIKRKRTYTNNFHTKGFVLRKLIKVYQKWLQ